MPTTSSQGDPFNDGSVQNLSAGLDLKYGLTSNITLDATVNPDFGQVEADPAVVNLTAFETFFEERRPFFIERADLFQFSEGTPETFFYSRRIGKSPFPVRHRGRAVRGPAGGGDHPGRCKGHRPDFERLVGRRARGGDRQGMGPARRCVGQPAPGNRRGAAHQLRRGTAPQGVRRRAQLRRRHVHRRQPEPR